MVAHPKIELEVNEGAVGFLIRTRQQWTPTRTTSISTIQLVLTMLTRSSGSRRMKRATFQRCLRTSIMVRPNCLKSSFAQDLRMQPGPINKVTNMIRMPKKFLFTTRDLAQANMKTTINRVDSLNIGRAPAFRSVIKMKKHLNIDSMNIRIQLISNSWMKNRGEIYQIHSFRNSKGLICSILLST